MSSRLSDSSSMPLTPRLFSQKFPKHKTIEDPTKTEHTLENLYPNTLYHIWIAAKSRRGEGAATPKLAVRTDQYGKKEEGPRGGWGGGVTFVLESDDSLSLFLA